MSTIRTRAFSILMEEKTSDSRRSQGRSEFLRELSFLSFSNRIHYPLPVPYARTVSNPFFNPACCITRMQNPTAVPMILPGNDPVCENVTWVCSRSDKRTVL